MTPDVASKVQYQIRHLCPRTAQKFLGQLKKFEVSNFW